MEGLSGLASGFDWRTLVDELAETERAPQKRLLTEQEDLRDMKSAYGTIAGQFNTLKTKVDALKDASLYRSRSSSSSDTSVGSASVSTGAPIGRFTFNIQQLATTASMQGTLNVGRKLNATDDVSALSVNDLALAQPLKSGTFTVNGKQITLSGTDTLQGLFDKISTATSGAVTGRYDSATDKIVLSSAGTITLGSATDTSNFLDSTKLYNNGTGSVSSAYALGAIDLSDSLANATFGTPITPATGEGEFKINGVSIKYTATDSVTTVLTRINQSNARVTASYDALQDRFILTNNDTGDMGMALEDVTGNFLTATGLSGGTISRGKNLLYTVNNGPIISSRSNTATGLSSGIEGLSLNVQKEGVTNVTIGVDTAKIRSAIEAFVNEYNKVQSTIDGYTASSTDSKGKVTAGVLSNETQALELTSQLRSLVNSVVGDATGTMKQLNGLGIDSNGYNDSIAIGDSDKLNTALTTRMAEVETLFTHPTSGLAVRISSYLTRMASEDGVLIDKQESLTKQANGIDSQIADLEKIVQANKDQMITSFLAMEEAQSNFNQQLTFLSRNLGQGS